MSAIMAATTLSRKSFYVYFRDRGELLVALVRPLRAEADTSIGLWERAADDRQAGRAALSAAARTYRTHGALLRALFWSASTDPELASARAELRAPVFAAARATIQALAPNSFVDPDAVARVLVTMNLHELLSVSPDASDHELDATVDALATVWERTLGI